jgi:Amt family ammonium transporter
LTGVVGILAPGIWADGNWGAGWNEIGVNQYLGVSGQGVTGLLAAPGLLADPGQFTAQWVALGSIAVGSCIAAAGLAALLRKSS